MAESVLGFKIDSSQAAHAAVDLDKMTAAAGKAEQAAIKVGTSASKASRDFGDLGPALQKIIGGIDKLNQTSSSIETKLETMGRAAGIAAQKTKTVGDAATASSAELNKLQAEVNTLTGALDKLKAKADKPIPAKMFGDQDEHVRNFRMEVERLTMKYQPLAQATRSYEATVAELNTAHRLGLISSQQLTTQLERERQSFERLKTSATTAGAAVKAAHNDNNANRAAGVNAGFQIQDVVTSAIGGSSVGMIAGQQGFQLAGAISSMERPVAGLAAAFASLLSPVSLISIGLVAGTAALVQYFTTSTEGTNGMSAELQRQADLIMDVADRWGEAAPKLKEYADQLQRAAEARKILAAGEGTAKAQFEPVVDLMGGIQQEYTAAIRELKGGGETTAQVVRTLGTAVGDLQTKIREGTATTGDLDNVQRAMASAVDQFGIPSVKRLRDSFAELVPQIQAAIEKAAGFRKEASGIARLGMYPSPGAYGGVERSADGPIQGGGLMLPENGPRPDGRPLIELEGLPGDKKTESEAEKAENLYKRSIESAKEQVEQMKLQAQTAGEAGVAADTFRFKLDLLQKAFKDGKEATADQRKDIDQLAESYRMAAQAAADARFASDIGFNARQSQRSGRDQQIASQLKGYGFGEDLNSPQADALRQQAQWKEAKDSATSFGQTFSSTLVSSSGDIGKSFAAALKGALEKETAKLWDRVFDGLGTMFANWLTGTPGAGGSTAGAGLGAVASAFTGKAANDNASYAAPVGAVTRGPLPSGDIASYIAKAASARGIDPDVALKVAQSEGGLKSWNLQSGFVKNGVREQSYGPFQLYKGGGLGNEFQRKTGMDPALASSGPAGVDFALDHAKKNGWGAWYGADRVGIDKWQGIGQGGAGADTASAALEKLASNAGAATEGLGTLGGGLNTLGQSLTAAPAAGGAGGGGLFGWLGSLFKPAATPAAGANANGTSNWRGGLSMVGERGPELLNLPQGSGVTSNHKLMEVLNGHRERTNGGGIAGIRVFMDDDMKLRAMVESISEKKSQQTSRQNLGSYKQSQQRSGLGTDQKAYNSRKG